MILYFDSSNLSHMLIHIVSDFAIKEMGKVTTEGHSVHHLHARDTVNCYSLTYI